MSKKIEYQLYDPIDKNADIKLSQYSALVRQLLFNRGIVNAEDAEAFLHPDYDTQLHDPFLFTDMEKAVDRILLMIKNNEHLTIYSDYDCDGIPGGVLLHDFFTSIGYKNFENYIPHRHDEGYGFNSDSIEKLVSSDTKLIITVDCGITDHAAVDVAKERGIDVIVTDHHEPSATLPDAYAVINPKRDDAYPFNGLCGTGVAYKLVQAVIARGVEAGVFEIKEGWEKWWLDMVGVATIADMVPLTGENRTLAHYGLRVLRKSRRPGLQHLLRKARIDQRYLSEDDIGFTIGPRINAASRMDTPEDAFQLLATRDEGEAGERVLHLERLNNERKGVVAAMTKELKKRMEGLLEVPEVIVLGNPTWRPSLVGLTAQGLVEEFGRPVFLWGRDGKGIIKGSCRSNGSMSIIGLMERAKDAFIEYGGHHASGGFSVSEDGIHVLSDRLNEAYPLLERGDLVTQSQQSIDLMLTLSDITDNFMRELELLGPYGMGNPKPLFQFTDVVPEDVSQFGKSKEHVKLRFVGKDRPLDAIAFFKQSDNFTKEPVVGVPITLIGHVERSYFMNRMQIRIRIIDTV
jgi:single-stranded-DNA-specific exonuclease